MLRDGTRQEIEARLLVPGDVLLIEEGESICADARLMAGTLEVDMSTLTGESVPVTRTAGAADPACRCCRPEDMVFSGTACTAGEAGRWWRTPACAPNWAVSRRSASAPGRTRARWSARSSGPPG